MFANGVIVWSNDYDTVLLPTAIFNYWLGLGASNAVDDPTRTQFDYIGLPKPTSDSPANVDTVAWDAKVNFERGIIGSKGGQISSVQGSIFGRYALNPAKWGLPTNQAPHTGMTQLTQAWLGQAFTGGEIWARGNPTKGFTTVELISGGVLNAWTADPSYADPTGSIVDDGLGNQVGSFQGGDIYSSTAGAFGVPSKPDDGNGHTLLSVYLADGGPKGWLGYPSGPSGMSPGGAAYSQFQNGLLVMYPNSGSFFTPVPFGNLTFIYDSAQDTGPTGCFGTNPFGAGCVGTSIGPFMSTTLTAYANGSSTPFAQGTWPGAGQSCLDQTAGATVCHQDGVFCDGSQQQINYTLPLGVASATTSITVNLTSQGYTDDCPGSASNSETGHLTLQFDIDNEWGANLARTVTAPDAGDFNFTSHVKNDFPYDHNDWRGELWWSFHNFDTDTMSVQTYSDTFVGVPNNFQAITNWGDGLYYQLVYKGSAANGNCFGMALDSIDAQFANRTAYDEPIHQWFTGTVDTQNGRNLDPTMDPAEADLGHELNVKFGYQLGVDSINYVLTNYPQALVAPLATLIEVMGDLASNGHPIISIATNLLFQDGHTIRPYRVGPPGQPCTTISTGSTCTRLYVLDPNIPSANASQEQYVEFSEDNQWAYAPSDNNGPVYPGKNYSGGLLSGGRIIMMPYSVLDHQPTTPIGELGALLAAAAIIICGDNAGVSQVTDEQGHTLYTTPNLGTAPAWSDLASGSAAIGNVTPIALSDTVAGSPQIFASRAPTSVHQYDIGLAQSQPNGTPYTVAVLSGLASTSVTVPGSTGVPDRLTLGKLGTRDKSVAFTVPSNGVAKQISWALSGPDKSRQMLLDRLGVQPAQQLTTILENGASRLKIENAGPATSGTLSLGQSTTPPVSTGTLNIPAGESGVDCSWTGTTPTCVTMPPEEGSIFGFESGSAWSPAWDADDFFPTTIVTSPKTQGFFALAIGSAHSDYRLLDSVTFSTSIFQGVTSKLALDVYVPNGPSKPRWAGEVTMYATCESAHVHHARLGELDLTGLPTGAFATATFNIPPRVLAAMTTAHDDFFFSIAVNSEPASESIVLDNLRFVP
jgi:hypothetical protein